MTSTIEQAIERRPFIKLTTGALAAATGCRSRSDRGYDREATVTLSKGFPDEGSLGLVGGALLFLPLVRFTESGELEGRLAQSWEHTADFRSWTYHIRPNLRWHDGTRVTAHDVKFTLDLLRHPDVLAAAPGSLAATVLDDWTVMVRAEHGLDYQTEASCWPRHLLERLDPGAFRRWEYWTRPVGNGPYRFVRQVPDTMAEVEANPDFFRGKPSIGRVRLKFSEQSGTSLIELLSGNVDVTGGNMVNSPLDKLDPRFRVYWGYEDNTARGIYWQNDHPIFRDPRARRALTLAINRPELLRVINMPSEIALVDGPYTQRQLRRGAIPAPLPYDPLQAGALLDAAGWQGRDRDGVRVRDGQPFRFTAIVFQPPYPQIALYVQAQFRQIGVHMDLQPLDDSIVMQRLEQGQFEAAFASVWNSSELLRDQRSSIGYRNPEVVALYRRAAEAADADVVDRAFGDLARIIRADNPVTFLCPKVNLQLVHRRIQGLRSPWRTEPMEFMEDLWLDDGRH